MQFDFAEIREKNQTTLIAFLHAEVALGMTFAQTAKIAFGEGHSEHGIQAKHNALAAVGAIRRLVPHVADEDARAEIAVQIVGLDGLISEL